MSAKVRHRDERGRAHGCYHHHHHSTPGLDKQYQDQTIRARALVLSRAAGKGDPEEIRAAYHDWERLAKEDNA